MDLATFQHILEERGLQSIALRAQKHHADKWLSLLVTDDHEMEFNPRSRIRKSKIGTFQRLY